MTTLPRFLAQRMPLIGLAGLPLHASATGFTDVTVAAGLSYTHSVNYPSSMHIMDGGAAARDFDGDGWVDLVVTRLDNDPILFRNKGDGTFEDVSAGSGVLMPEHGNGTAWGDIDNDGDPDLYITRTGWSFTPTGTPKLFINQGNGSFVEDAQNRGASLGPVGDWFYGTSATFGDYDRDGWLDLHTNEWGTTWNTFGQQEPTSHTRLLNNQGHASPGHFVDRTDFAGVSAEETIGSGTTLSDMQGAFAFSSAFSDLNLDGHTDLIIVSDFLTSQLFLNEGDNTFADVTATTAFGTDENGMGLAVGDYNNDGLQDIFVTSIYHPDPAGEGHNLNGNHGVTGNRLFKNLGNGDFLDVTDAAGVRDGGWGWGSSFFDYDNDGDLDLIMTNGYPFFPDFLVDATKLFRNNGDETFTEVGAGLGITDTDMGKALLTFDYDRDGDLDVFIVNNGSTPILYRNDLGSTTGSWLKLELEGTESNRDGVGARILVQGNGSVPDQYRELGGVSNYLSQNDIVEHVGLGDSTMVDLIRIEWPSGTVQEITNVPVNLQLKIMEPGTGSSLRLAMDGGNPVLSWRSSWLLESSSDLVTWSPVAGATSPWTTPGTGGGYWRIADPSVVFTANFNDGDISSWTPTGGIWTASEGEIEQSSTTGNLVASSGEFSWTDYEMVTRVTLLEGTGAGIQCRVQPDGSCYEVVLASNSLTLSRGDAGTLVPLALVPVSVGYGRPTNLILRVNGDRLEAYLNGVRLISVEDTGYGSGKVALKTSDARARFDDVIIRQR